MKNLTLSIDEETYRRARIKAAANDTSVSAMVRTILEELTSERADEHASLNNAARERLRKRFGAVSPAEYAGEKPDERFERLLRKQIELRAQLENFAAADNVPRGDLYRRGRDDGR